MPCFARNGAGCRRGRYTMRRLIYLQQKTTKRTITHMSSGKQSRIPQFYAVSDTESLEKAGFWGPKRGRNKMNNTESAGFILHQAWILHPILHPKYPTNKGTFKDWCRNVGEKHKTFFGESRLRKCKTPDFFEVNLRTFEAKHRNFTSKKSDVFGFRTGSELPKKTGPWPLDPYRKTSLYGKQDKRSKTVS